MTAMTTMSTLRKVKRTTIVTATPAWRKTRNAATALAANPNTMMSRSSSDFTPTPGRSRILRYSKRLQQKSFQSADAPHRA